MNSPTVDFSSNKEFVDIIETIMRKNMYYGSHLFQLLGANFAKTMGMEEEVKALGPGQTENLIGAPIENVAGFKDRSGLFMEIPFLNRLKDLPGAYGNGPLKGSEETDQYDFVTVQVNRTRKAFAPPVGMNLQAVKSWRKYLLDNARPKLTQWFQDFQPSNFLSALHYGGSRELIAPTSSNGRGMTVVSHPNMFVCGLGKVSYAGGRPGSAGYETSVETALNSIAGGEEQYRMSPEALDDFIQSLPELKMKPIAKKNGKPLYPVLMHPVQFGQISRHQLYREYVQSLRGMTMEEHPLAHLATAIYKGALIITDVNLWYAYTAAMGFDSGMSAGAVEYGPRPTSAQRAKGNKTGNTIDNLDGAAVSGVYPFAACAFALGESALIQATAEELTFHEQMEDYDAVQGTGIDTIKSIIRTDKYNKLNLITLGDGTVLAKDAFVDNTSSAMLVSFSPRNRAFGASV